MYIAPSVESRIGPKGGLGSIPGHLSTLSKPNPYPKFENAPAPKWFSKPNL